MTLTNNPNLSKVGEGLTLESIDLINTFANRVVLNVNEVNPFFRYTFKKHLYKELDKQIELELLSPLQSSVKGLSYESNELQMYKEIVTLVKVHLKSNSNSNSNSELGKESKDATLFQLVVSGTVYMVKRQH